MEMRVSFFWVANYSEFFNQINALRCRFAIRESDYRNLGELHTLGFVDRKNSLAGHS